MTNNHFNFLLMCSGGSDSMFLLNQLFNYFNNTATSDNTDNSHTSLLNFNSIDLLSVTTDNSTNCEVINLHVVYVNHNISTHSKAWGDVVRNYCDQLKIKNHK